VPALVQVLKNRNRAKKYNSELVYTWCMPRRNRPRPAPPLRNSRDDHEFARGGLDHIGQGLSNFFRAAERHFPTRKMARTACEVGAWRQCRLGDSVLWQGSAHQRPDCTMPFPPSGSFIGSLTFAWGRWSRCQFDEKPTAERAPARQLRPAAKPVAAILPAA